MIRLETPRLRLRTFTPEDAESLYDLDHDPRVMRFIGPYALSDVAAYRERIAITYAGYDDRTDGLGLWVVTEKNSGVFLGWVCLRPANEYRFAAEASFADDDAELGYRLIAESWGQGYATEASRALVADAFFRGATPRVVATALVTNLGSLRVMQKSGLNFAGQFQLPGFETPSLKYQLTRHEFFA